MDAPPAKEQDAAETGPPLRVGAQRWARLADAEAKNLGVRSPGLWRRRGGLGLLEVKRGTIAHPRWGHWQPKGRCRQQERGQARRLRRERVEAPPRRGQSVARRAKAAGWLEGRVLGQGGRKERK